MWGSRVVPLKETEGTPKEVSENTDIAGPMTVGGGNIPATTLWWDGWTIAKNASDADAEATFLAMMNGVSPKMLNETTSPQAVWLIDGYKPTPDAKGVFAAAQMNSVPYPMLPFQGLLHSALGAELADFMLGKESAAKTLSDAEAAYTAAAKEKGYL
jgi:trehalose/maltose transport system substrate-binding protein